MSPTSLVIGAILGVVAIVLANLRRIERGELLGLLTNGRTHVGRAGPVAPHGDLSDATAVLTQMPMRHSFEIAIALPSVEFHIIAVRTQINFQRLGIHIITLSIKCYWQHPLSCHYFYIISILYISQPI